MIRERKTKRLPINSKNSQERQSSGNLTDLKCAALPPSGQKLPAAPKFTKCHAEMSVRKKKSLAERSLGSPTHRPGTNKDPEMNLQQRLL